jgi:hypothetical protein
VPNCLKTAEVYTKSWTAGLANSLFVRLKDAYDNDVPTLPSRLVVAASYVIQPAPAVVVSITMSAGGAQADIAIFVNRTGNVNFRLSLDSEPTNPFFNLVATVGPSLYSATQTFAIPGVLANTLPPYPTVFANAGSLPIQPWCVVA